MQVIRTKKHKKKLARSQKTGGCQNHRLAKDRKRFAYAGGSKIKIVPGSERTERKGEFQARVNRKAQDMGKNRRRKGGNRQQY